MCLSSVWQGVPEWSVCCCQYFWRATTEERGVRRVLNGGTWGRVDRYTNLQWGVKIAVACCGECQGHTVQGVLRALHHTHCTHLTTTPLVKLVGGTYSGHFWLFHSFLPYLPPFLPTLYSPSLPSCPTGMWDVSWEAPCSEEKGTAGGKWCALQGLWWWWWCLRLHTVCHLLYSSPPSI